MSVRFASGVAVVAISLAWIPVPARASAIVYSDLGPSDAYTYTSGFDVTGTDSGSLGGSPFSEVAAPFTPQNGFQFGQIDVALLWPGPYFGNTNSAVVTLDSDDNGLPGAVLESWSLVDTLPFITSGMVLTLSASAPLELVAGDQYWVVASPEASNSMDEWASNSIGVTTPYAQNAGSGFGLIEPANGVTTPAFDVQGTSVPEPSATLLFAFSASVLVAFRQRQRVTN